MHLPASEPRSCTSPEETLSFGAQGWGWEGAGSRRWGWCDAAVNQTAFKRAGEEGSTGVGEVLNGYEMCINSPEVI